VEIPKSRRTRHYAAPGADGGGATRLGRPAEASVRAVQDGGGDTLGEAAVGGPRTFACTRGAGRPGRATRSSTTKIPRPTRPAGARGQEPEAARVDTAGAAREQALPIDKKRNKAGQAVAGRGPGRGSKESMKFGRGPRAPAHAAKRRSSRFRGHQPRGLWRRPSRTRGQGAPGGTRRSCGVNATLTRGPSAFITPTRTSMSAQPIDHDARASIMAAFMTGTAVAVHHDHGYGAAHPEITEG